MAAAWDNIFQDDDEEQRAEEEEKEVSRDDSCFCYSYLVTTSSFNTKFIF